MDENGNGKGASRFALLAAEPDVASDCRIPGMTRLSGWACLLHQVGSSFPRYTKIHPGYGPPFGHHLNVKFSYCPGCRHWLSDQDYRNRILWLRTHGRDAMRAKLSCGES